MFNFTGYQEMQIKTTMRYYFTSVGMKISKRQMISTGKDVEKHKC